MNGLQIGELAALGTALLWTLSALAWTTAGREIGSLAVSFHRLLVAAAFLAAYGGVVRQRWLPTDAGAETWLLLGLSGLVGFFLCDVCLFRALVLIGPRLTLLVQSLSPPTAAVISWLFLGEALTGRHWLAMAVTLAGVTWVVLEGRQQAVPDPDEPAAAAAGRSARRIATVGLLLAGVAAIAQAVGMVLSRQGIGQYDAAAGTLIRIVGSLPGYLVLLSVLARWPAVFGALRHGRAMGVVVAGSIVGPFLGVMLCMIALRHSPAGVVTTLVSTMPVLILPLSVLVLRERVTLRAAAGAAVSVLGVALMCWEF